MSSSQKLESQVKTPEEFFQHFWQDYTQITPQAQRVHDLLEAEGEKVINDHVALRTLDFDSINKDVLAESFLRLGYEKRDDYDFPEKKLKATFYTHKTNPKLPKVFISQLLTQQMTPKAAQILKESIDSFWKNLSSSQCVDLCLAGRNWDVSYETYQELYSESEYAAWFYLFGLRVNHFTVLINELKKFSNIKDLNQFLKDNSFALNTSGGEIKGSPELFLEQSSTMASKVTVSFTDGTHDVPSCYYEFAKRYPDPKTNKIYEGFVASSATRIFESTNNEGNLN